MADNPAIFRGDGGEVSGRFVAYTLQTLPDWHQDAQDDDSCGQLTQTLEVTLHFDDEQRISDYRRTTPRIAAAGKSTLVLDDLRFRGWVTSAAWQAVADADGRVRSASLTLNLRGFED